MPRPLRVQYPGAIYHVMSRGDRREMIYRDDADRETFLQTLGEACAKTGWQAHAWCLMGNHFHLLVETPQANLAVGMQWLLGTFTVRFNRRHRLSGHLFGGRYKAQPIDERSAEYLVTAGDYVHLNPARAGLIAPGEPLESWRWSSYPAYLRSGLRPPWLRVDRLLGEHGLGEGAAASLREYARRMEWVRRQESPGPEALREHWWYGAGDFVERLAERIGRMGQAGERATEREQTDEQWAARLLGEGLREMNLDAGDLATLPKSDSRKIALAHRLRTQTPMTRQWIAQRLRMGSPSYLSNLLGGQKCRK